MFLNYRITRQMEGYLCVRDVEAGQKIDRILNSIIFSDYISTRQTKVFSCVRNKKVDEIIRMGLFGVGLYLSVNSRFESDKQDLYLYQPKMVSERVVPSSYCSLKELEFLEGTGNGTILAVQKKANNTAEIKEASDSNQKLNSLKGNDQLISNAPFFPVEGFSFGPQQIVRNARDRAESAVAEKLAPLAQAADECQEAYNEYKVYNKMSSTLSKVSKKVRKDKETSKSLDKLEEQLKNGEFHAGRGAEKLTGTKNVYYMRAGNRGRLFFRYSEEEKGAVEKLAESNKDKEQEVIDNLKQNYK